MLAPISTLVITVHVDRLIVQCLFLYAEEEFLSRVRYRRCVTRILPSFRTLTVRPKLCGLGKYPRTSMIRYNGKIKANSRTMYSRNVLISLSSHRRFPRDESLRGSPGGASWRAASREDRRIDRKSRRKPPLTRVAHVVGIISRSFAPAEKSIHF